MHSRHAIACALVAAAGSAAPAGVFTWTGSISQSWNDAANWAGPGGLYPRLTGDSAIVSGNQVDAFLSASTALGSLSIFNGATVYSSGNTLFVDGNANLSGDGATLTVTDSPALRDLDVDALRIDDAFVVMYDGLAQVDASLLIEGEDGGVILGTGTVEMNSTTGDLIVDDGALWAMGGQSSGPTLHVTRTNSSTSRLDWTSADSLMIAWDGKALHNTLPYTGPLGGEISVSGFGDDSRFVSDEGFIAGPGSTIRLIGNADGTTRIETPFVDSYGELNVSGAGRIDTDFLGLRGTGTIGEDSSVTITAPALLFDSFTFSATGPNTLVRFSDPFAAMLVQGGTTTFDLGETGVFDLDGGNAMEVTIADGSTLDIRAGSIDASVESFGGTLNVEGTLHVESYGWPQPGWDATGSFNVQGGEITGRRFTSAGTISGHGVIDTMVHNDGLVEAVGGTLQFAGFDLDGTGATPQAGVVRAEQGDISVMKSDSGGYLPTNGQLYVGNGVGGREVFEMNQGLIVWDGSHGTGLVSLNGGAARFGRARMQSEFVSTNNSLVTISGAGDSDGLEFFDGSATITGALEVFGNVMFWPDVSMTGGGTIHATSTVKSVNFIGNGTSGDVSIVASGGVEIGTYGYTVGQASTAGLTMLPTARLGVNIEGVAASDEFSTFDVTGDAELDGTLVVRWTGDADEIAPLGEVYTVLTAANVSGSFESVDFSGLGETRRAHVGVTPTAVEVTVTCISDFDGNGVLDLSDIDAFIVAFIGNDALADIAAPFGVFDLDDIDLFVTTFQNGCVQ